MSTVSANTILDATGGNTATINGATPTVYNTMGKNRIINSAMEIDQRNAGSSVTPTNGQYLVDRWQATTNVSSKFSVQQSTEAPAGFSYSMKATSLSAYSIGAGELTGLRQHIEGYNCNDLDFGTSDAKTVTLSFWVRSSLTGTFGVSLMNGSANYSYPATYTISSADTWEYKTITITGATAGTWSTTTSTGMSVLFGLGVGTSLSGTAGSWAAAGYYGATGATSVVGTNGATFYITGVQLEVGSVATEFERRPYGMELALCQRYYEKSYSIDVVPGTATANGLVYMSTGNSVAGDKAVTATFKVEKRSNPSISYWDSPGNASRVDSGGTNRVGAINWQNTVSVNIRNNAGGGYGSADIGYQFVASAEL